MSEGSTGVTKVVRPIGDESMRLRELKELERTPLFQALPRRHRRKVADLAEVEDFRNGAAVVRAGDQGDSFYILLQGEALVVTPDGQERFLTAGDHLGELSLIDGAPRAATVEAVGPATAARISRSDFQALLHEEPALAVGLLPGLVLILRDLMHGDSGHIADHGQLQTWRDGDGEETLGQALEGRDALGWLVLVRHVGVFQGLAERHLRRIVRYVTVERFADGSTVVLAGARGDALHIILGGRARVRTPGGRTRTLEVDDCFGELSLLDGAPRAATVSAIGELTTAKITRADFQKLLKGEPGMAVGLLDGLVATVRDIQRETAPT